MGALAAHLEAQIRNYMLTRYYPKWQCPCSRGTWLDWGRVGGWSRSRNDLAGPNSLVRTGETLTWNYGSVHHCKSSGNFDNIALHRPEDGEQLALFFLRHVEGIQRTDQVLHECVEGSGGDLHALVRRLHITTRIGAGATARRTHLFDQELIELLEIGGREKAIDALVCAHIADELGDDGLDSALSAEPLIERRSAAKDGALLSVQAAATATAYITIFLLNVISSTPLCENELTA